MKQHSFIIGTLVTVAILLSGITACTIEETQPEWRRITLRATIEGPGTKVVIDDNNPGSEGQFHWNMDDALAVYASDGTVGSYYFTENKFATWSEENQNLFDLYLPDGTSRSHFAFWPIEVLNRQSDPDAPVVVLPDRYEEFDYRDGGRCRNYSQVPMIAINNNDDPNLNFRHLGGLIRLDVTVPEEIYDPHAGAFFVAVGTMVDGVFRAYRIPKNYTVVNPNPADINTGNCYIQLDETDYEEGEYIWKQKSSSIPAASTCFLRLYVDPHQTLNLPVPVGKYDVVVVRYVKNLNNILGEATYSLGPDGWVCRRRHAKKLSVTFNPEGTRYVLDDLENVELPYTGGDATLRADQLFKSYKKYKLPTAEDSTEVPVPYRLQYSVDNGASWSNEAPDWLLNAPTTSAGSITGEDLPLTVAPQINSAYDSHHDNLIAFGEKTGFDLSTYNVATGTTVSRTTANCYVVQGYGSFKFPLVYGNGVKGGAVNESAYRGKAGPDATGYRPDAGDRIIEEGTDGWYLGRFKDHLDQNITSPYIATQQSGKSLTAVVLWSDVQNLVTDVAVSGSGQNSYLTFNVPEETVTQGNALVAVLADGVIAWSWHIWVTDEDLTAVKEGSNGYMFAPVNLGWCDGKTDIFAARSCLVRAVQDESNEVKGPVTITQTAGTLTVLGNSPYYQWGRKDPMQAAAGNGSTLKTYYVHEGYALQPRAAGPVSLGTAIQNPHKLYTNGSSSIYDWCSTSYFNTWNSTLNSYHHDAAGLHESAPVTKTIYDPSPVGFMMPPQAAFGTISTSNSSWQGSSSTNSGLLYNGTLFFPALGVRYHNADLDAFNSQGRYNSATPLFQSYGEITQFSSGSVNTKYETLRTRGNSVRPVREIFIVTGEDLKQWD